MTTPKERFAALMQGQLPDRVPIVCNLMEQGAREMGMTIKEYYSQGENVALGQMALAERFGQDMVWSFHYTATDAEILGSKNTIFSEDGPPNVGHLILNSPEDIRNLTIDREAIINSRPFKEEVKTMTILKKNLGHAYPILSSVVASYSMPAILIGIEKWMELLYSSSDLLSKALIEKCSDYCQIKIKALFDAGVDMVSYSNPLGSSAFITPQQFDRDAINWINRDVEPSGTAGIVYFNGGGTINKMIPTLMKKSDFRAFYIHPNDDIKEAKAIVNKQGMVASPINDIRLLRYSEEEVITEVRRIIKEGKEGGGFIFGTLVMPFHIKDNIIKTMIDTAKKIGAY